MGTADYLAPEQALSLHNVDSRADVYSLGATFYALLAGEPPFHEGTITQKLLWHQMRSPKPLRERRPDMPEGLAKLISAMMAKAPEERVQTGAEIAALVEPYCTGSPTPPAAAPPDSVLPNSKKETYVKAGTVNGVKAGRPMTVIPTEDAVSTEAIRPRASVRWKAPPRRFALSRTPPPPAF